MSALATVLALVIVFALPVRGALAHRRLETRLGVDPNEPIRTFRRSAVVKWSLTAVALVVLLGDPRLGLLLFGDWLGVLFPLALGVVGGAFLLRLRLRSDAGQDAVIHQLGKTAALLPVTPTERRAWVFLSITAGITEEVLYRAFLLTYLDAYLPGLGLAGAAILAGTAFGSVHAYQGWRGVVLTAILGILFGFLYPWTGLVVLVVAHTLVDLRVLLVPPELVRKARADRG